MVSSSVFKALLVSFALSGGAGAACTRYIEAHQGDTCAILASAAGITVAQFLRSNPGVSSCNQLVNGGNYCIEGVADSAPQASTSTSSSRPSQTSSPGRLTISTDGNCGNGVTCLGSTFGNCCSQFGFCGATADYCLSEGCQTAFGLCGAGAISSSAGPSITPPPGPTVTVTVTSVGAVTRTSLVYETRTTTTAATVLTTQTVRVTASTTVTNTVAQSVAITATATTTRTIQTVATVTSTVLQTSAAVITRTSTVPATSYNIITLTTIETKTSTVPATSYDIITLTTIETKAITITSTTLRTSTTTTTTTRVIQTVIPVTETLTSIVTSVSTRFITAVTGACSTTPTRPSLVTTTQASGGRPTPLLPGTPSNCRNFAVIRGDDTCRTLAQSNGLTLLQFYDLNPSVGTDAGILGLFCTIDLLDLLLSGLCQINCDQLWEGYYVCVGK